MKNKVRKLNEFKVQAKVFNVKANPTNSGGMIYKGALSFGVKNKQDEWENAWMNCLSFDAMLENKKEYILTGYIKAEAGWQDRPAGLVYIVTDAVSAQVADRTQKMPELELDKADAPW